jgi:peptide/nickel transport system substrate-binding protein
VDGFGLFSKPDVEQVDLVHAGLVRMNLATGREEPWVAEQLPSIENGSWTVSPEGTMETIYRLRQGIQWHDGTPLSSQDFAFGLSLARDPKVPSSLPGQGDKMERIETPDDRTLVIQWKTSYRLADRLIRTDLFALPKHLLESVYLSGDVDRFVNASFWLHDFVGTGPFKIGNIELGSSIELIAFDDYFLGRPRIDAITLQQVDNINTMLTYVLSGTIDVALNNSFTIDAGLTAKREWETRGQGQVTFCPR